MLKNKAIMMIAGLMIFVGGVVAANASITEGTVLKFSVAEEFVINGKTFEPGIYTIERTPMTADSSSILVIRGDKASMVFDTIVAETRKASESTEMVFENLNGVNYLKAITVKGATTVNELPSAQAQAR